MKRDDILKSRIAYYTDELNDDFGEIGLSRPDLPSNYQYVHHNIFRSFFGRLLYFVVAKPILAIYCFFHGIRVQGKENLKGLKKTGAYIYANHVSHTDPFKFQVIASNTRRVNIIGFTDVLTIPVVRTLLRMSGYLPVPNKGDLNNLRRLNDAVGYYVNKKHQFLVVYPEMHIWPYYTKIRHFDPTTLLYPATHPAPIVPAVTVWKKRGGNKKPKQIVKFGKPIYPDATIDPNQNKDILFAQLYQAMDELSRSEEQYSYIQYIKKDQ